MYVCCVFRCIPDMHRTARLSLQGFGNDASAARASPPGAVVDRHMHELHVPLTATGTFNWVYILEEHEHTDISIPVYIAIESTFSPFHYTVPSCIRFVTL